MGVVAAGVGDVDVAGGAEGVDGLVAEGGQVLWSVAGAGLAVVLGEGDVAHVVGAVLDSPVVALIGGDLGRAGVLAGEAGDAVGDLFAGALPVQGADAAHGAEDLRGAGEDDPGRGSHPQAALLGAAVAAVGAVVTVGKPKGQPGLLSSGAGGPWNEPRSGDQQPRHRRRVQSVPIVRDPGVCVAHQPPQQSGLHGRDPIRRESIPPRGQR